MDHDGPRDDKDKARDSKRAKNGDESLQGNLDSISNDEKETSHNPPKDTSMEVMIRSMAEQILDGACDQLFEECCEKVLAEDDDMSMDGMVQDVTLEEGRDLFSMKANLVHTLSVDSEQPVQRGKKRKSVQ